MSYGNPYHPPGNQPAPLWRPQAPVNAAPPDPYSPPRDSTPYLPPPVAPPPKDQFTPGAWIGDLFFVVALLSGLLLLTYACIRPFFSVQEVIGG